MTTYLHDPLNRITGQANPLGQRTTYVFDARGDRIATTNPLNETASRAADGLLSDRTWQRVWKRFNRAQSTIRTALLGRCPPPQLPAEPRPAAQVLAHLHAAFPTPTVWSPPSNMRCGPSSCKTAPPRTYR